LLNPALHCDFDVLCRRRGTGNAGLIRHRCVADYEPVTGALLQAAHGRRWQGRGHSGRRRLCSWSWGAGDRVHAQYVAPSTGRPIPLLSHSNDQWRSPASSAVNVRESNLRILW